MDPAEQQAYEARFFRIMSEMLRRNQERYMSLPPDERKDLLQDFARDARQQAADAIIGRRT
jgi:hypothetical protein